MNADDTAWMRRALELAERGRGHVEPNPLVGAVVVHGGRSVGEGWHEKYGQAHAEVNALAAAGELARGATLYVTLEPCCHHGKTPPCTDAVVRAGITRVVAALHDPFPQVAGQGAALLREAGVTVDFGLDVENARRQNAPYLTLLRAGRPYVHAKWAMGLDGKIATHTGDSRWISNETSRRVVHELRGRMDALVVGIGTALADDPLLTARPPGPRTATRVILDGHARLPLQSQLVRSAREVPTLVAVTSTAPLAAVGALRDGGCEVLTVPANEAGRVALLPMLAEFGRRRWTNVLVEGGAAVLGAFADARLMDEVHVFIAPTLIGGAASSAALGGLGVETMREAVRIEVAATESLEGDIYVRGHPRSTSADRG